MSETPGQGGHALPDLKPQVWATFGSRRAHLVRPSGRTRWDGSRLITDRAAFWCATPHRMVSETEELDRWSPQSHRPSLADQNLSYNSQPWGLALLTKASMFQPLLPFDCWATVLSGRPRNHLAGRLSPACPIAPGPDACGR